MKTMKACNECATVNCPQGYNDQGICFDCVYGNKLAPVAQLRMSDQMRDFIEGMSVSVDVSTGEHDAGNRYFGTVTEVMNDLTDKHGVTLLVQNAEPNFASPAGALASQSTPVAQELSDELMKKFEQLPGWDRSYRSALRCDIEAILSANRTAIADKSARQEK